MKLEEKLISLRKEKGISQQELAEIMNISRQTISRWETGATIPTTDNLTYLGKLYDISIEYLLCNNITDHHANQQPDVKSETNTMDYTHQTVKIKVLFLVIIGIFIGILGTLLFESFIGTEKQGVPISDIKGGEIIIEGGFKLD